LFTVRCVAVDGIGRVLADNLPRGVVQSLGAAADLVLDHPGAAAMGAGRGMFKSACALLRGLAKSGRIIMGSEVLPARGRLGGCSALGNRQWQGAVMLNWGRA
jgi:hypothetical protein